MDVKKMQKPQCHTITFPSEWLKFKKTMKDKEKKKQIYTKFRQECSKTRTLVRCWSMYIDMFALENYLTVTNKLNKCNACDPSILPPVYI